MTFEITRAIPRKEGWVEYIDKNLNIGVELELSRGITQSEERNIFGVRHTEYHEYPTCDACEVRNQCGHRERNIPREMVCHQYARKNLIIAIQTDGSLGDRGSEFLLHTGNISTDEFIARFPIKELINNGYEGTRSGSIHTHLLIPWFKKEMPTVIFENMWSMFRYYYVGMAYLTGTARHCVLRNTGYATFYTWTMDWKDKIMHNERDMMYFAYKDIDGDKMRDFNIEIRMYDDSVNIKHIALCRILGKLLMMRAAELSEFGRWVFKADETWSAKSRVIEGINHHSTMNRDNVSVMKSCAKELYVELEHLMTPTEKDCLMSMMRNPIWRGGSRVDRDVLNEGQEDISELEIMLKTKALRSDTRMEYYSEMARMLNTTPEVVRVKLSKCGAKWNKQLGLFSISK